MKALVTGSSGFVGRHMAAELSHRGYAVEGWDIAVGRDCLDLFRDAQPAERYDLVVHAAARSPHRYAIDHHPATLVYNQLLDAAMFDWALRTRQRRVLYFSSCAALDDQPDPYGLWKLTGERMAGQARVAELPVTVVRPYSGYGADQAPEFPFRAFIDRARAYADPFDIWGNGRQVRDWIHINDVVHGALAVAASGTTDPVSLCTGIGTSMLDVARMACDSMGYEPTFRTRTDMPAGNSRRVGDPHLLHRYYQPGIAIEQGVKLAMGA